MISFLFVWLDSALLGNLRPSCAKIPMYNDLTCSYPKDSYYSLFQKFLDRAKRNWGFINIFRFLLYKIIYLNFARFIFVSFFTLFHVFFKTCTASTRWFFHCTMRMRHIEFRNVYKKSFKIFTGYIKFYENIMTIILNDLLIFC